MTFLDVACNALSTKSHLTTAMPKTGMVVSAEGTGLHVVSWSMVDFLHSVPYWRMEFIE